MSVSVRWLTPRSSSPHGDASASIGEAVASALMQPDVAQVLVVDDASADATTNAALAADDDTRRLEIIRLNSNEGPAAARNMALRRVRTDYACVLGRR